MIEDANNGDNPDLPNLRYAIPGDILDWSGEHVVIILAVNPDNDGNVRKRNQVEIIQAGAGPAYDYRVMTKQTWGDGVGLETYQLYQVRRLRTTN